MIFYSLSPFATPYLEELGQSHHRRENYRASWHQVENDWSKESGEDESILDGTDRRFPRSARVDQRFEASAAGEFRARDEVAIFSLNPLAILPGDQATSTTGAEQMATLKTTSCTLTLDAARLSVYSHGAAILEFAWRVDNPDLAAITKDLVSIQSQLFDKSQELARCLVNRLVFLARRTGIIAGESKVQSEQTLWEPKWTSGALVLAGENLSPAEAKAWLGDQGLSDKRIRAFCESTEGSDQLASWMRYTYRIDETNPAAVLDSAPLRAMRYCQYIFAAADLADESLSVALGRSYDTVQRTEIADVRTALSESSNRLRVIEIEHSGLMKLLALGERSSINQTLDQWQFREVIMNPAKSKSLAAQERLTELSDISQRTANLISEVILLGIALTSLFGTMLALAQYGRSMVSDPTYSSYAQESGSLLDFIAGVSTNGMIIGTFIVCLLLSVGYLAVKIRIR